MAVLEYCQSHAAGASYSGEGTSIKESITGVISDMLQVDSSSRPSTAQLFESFTRFYQVSQKTESLAVSPPLIRPPIETNTEDWSPKMSWISLKPDSSPTVFRVYDQKPGTDWLVLHVIVNKPNTRIVIVSCDDNQQNYYIKLRDIRQENHFVPIRA